MTPIQKAVTECLQWMRENHEDENKSEFDKAALLVSGSVAALEAQLGKDAPEMKRLRASEKRLLGALEAVDGLAPEAVRAPTGGVYLTVNLDEWTEAIGKVRAALAADRDAHLAADVATDTASAGLVLT